MNYKIFGQKTGLRVSELALGTGNFGTGWGHGAGPEVSREIFGRYIDAGGNFIDTADGYQGGQSEEILSSLISGIREEIVLASKYSAGGNTLQTSGSSRKNMVRSVEESLKRLKTDRIDLYWAHISDHQTPIEEIVRAFDDLVRDGKIVYAGFSNFPAWRIASASLLADLRGWSPVAGIQVEYNLIERSAERDLLPMAEALGLGTAFWSPLAGGTLTGKYRNGAMETESRQNAWKGNLVKGEDGERETNILDALESIADSHDARVLDIALAWIRQRHDRSVLSTVTILGPRTLSQLNDNLDSLKISLTGPELDLLTSISSISLGVPHQMISDSHKGLFGGAEAGVMLKRPVG